VRLVVYHKEEKQFRAILRIFFFFIFASLHSFIASGGQGALFEKTAPWTPAKTFY
jgi:hypothetical protein